MLVVFNYNRTVYLKSRCGWWGIYNLLLFSFLPYCVVACKLKCRLWQLIAHADSGTTQGLFEHAILYWHCMFHGTKCEPFLLTLLECHGEQLIQSKHLVACFQYNDEGRSTSVSYYYFPYSLVANNNETRPRSSGITASLLRSKGSVRMLSSRRLPGWSRQVWRRICSL